MNKFSFTLAWLLFARIIAAQNLSPTVVNASGGIIQNNSNRLEWSLGELAVSTLTSPANWLTQGFLQGDEIGLVATKSIFDETRLSVFPNPVKDKLTMQTDLLDITSILVHDASGRLMLQTEFQQSIDLRHLNTGVYVISLLDKQNQLLHTFKINKF